MRRLVLFGLLVSVSCTPATRPSVIAGVSLTNNASGAGVFPSDTFRVFGTAYDANGDATTLFPVLYTSTNTSVATVGSDGLVTALTAGTTQIKASADGVSSGAYQITVDGNVTGRVVVTPNTPTVKAGSQVQLTASVVTTVGNPARGKSVTWSTSDATKATVDSNGNVSAIAVTSGVSICATANDAPSIKGCATVTVN